MRSYDLTYPAYVALLTLLGAWWVPEETGEYVTPEQGIEWASQVARRIKIA